MEGNTFFCVCFLEGWGRVPVAGNDFTIFMSIHPYIHLSSIMFWFLHRDI